MGKGPPFPLALPHPRRKLLFRSVWHVPAAGRKACHLPRPGKERVRQAEKERRQCGRCPAGNRARMAVQGTGGGYSKKNLFGVGFGGAFLLSGHAAAHRSRRMPRLRAEME